MERRYKKRIIKGNTDGKELKFLYENGLFDEELQTLRNLYILQIYEMEQHRNNTGNGNFEYNEIIKFCDEKFAMYTKEERLESVRSYYDYVNIRAFLVGLLKRRRVIVSLFAIVACVGFTGSFMAYSINKGVHEFKRSSTNEDDIQVKPTETVIVAYDDNYFNWLPKGYSKKIYMQEQAKYGVKHIYEYMHSNKNNITLQIQELFDPTFIFYAEKNKNEETTMFIVSGVRYYRSKNMELNQILWSNNDAYFSLYGDVDMNVLEGIIRKNNKK